ncbi:hypothetical protein [Nocardia sp. SYP-A9097]|uniref:hypothetical protein n=1 Tax=Nocardia sp. SYP-A9097 TaxID=2663237 RepID=UPI001E4E5510|nr:hypothetical protein [Nocardia sp. SYP-A9097]
MTEDVSQLSVAELLARNGQGAAPNAGGGGRRRRSGRGISVADLTGDIPVVRSGSSSHAASDDGGAALEESAPAAPAPQPNSGESDYSNYPNYSNNSDYSNFPDYSDFSYSSPTPQADYPDYSGYTAAPDPEPEYSPLSGPISYYDPLAAPQPPSLPEPSGYQWPGGSDRPNGHAAPAPEQPRSGRRRKPDPLDADVSLAELEDPAAAVREEGGRRRRFDPDEDTTEVRPFHGAGRSEPPAGNDSAMGALDSAGRSRQFDAAPAWSPEPVPRTPSAPTFDPLAASLAPPPTPAAPAAPPMSRSARRHAEAQRAVEAERPAPPPARSEPQWQQPEPQWQNDPRRQPEPWQPSAPRRQPEPWQPSAPQPEADWQQSAQRPPQPQQPWQDQDQWHDDEPVAPQRDEPRRNGRFGRGAAESGRGAGESGRAAAESGRGALPAWSARRRQSPEPAPREHGSIPTAAWTSPDQDQQLVSGGTVAGDLLHNALELEDERAERDSRRVGKRRIGGSRRRGHDEHPEPDEHLTDVYSPLDEDDDYDDEYDDEPRVSMAERFSAITSKFTARTGSLTAGRKSEPARAAGNRLSTEDENRRQWLVLGGQSAGAAVTGMLLFKGFERMWEMLPWVALALAMIVILGLVALVRVLRRTDDIFSTVIAVVVGVFVTLGPLAFLLSTN